jgi:8-oxo-dGTP pyrophosphatase MutT (NUDIX family)
MNQYKIYNRLLDMEKLGQVGCFTHEGKVGWLASFDAKQKFVQPKAVKSAGVVLYNINTNKIFLVHPTGQTLWDIPKGQIDPGENDTRITAVRELEEETGFDIPHTALGAGQYLIAEVNDYKDIKLYKYTVNKDPFINKPPRCRSYFEDLDCERVPEVDAYAWVKRNQIHHYLPEFLVQKVLDTVTYTWR